MEEALHRKFKDKMEDLHAYLDLIKTKLPMREIRKGLKHALTPVGVHVDVTDDPLLTNSPANTNPFGYSEFSPSKYKRGRQYGGKRTTRRKR